MRREKYVWQCVNERAESTERGARGGIGGCYEDEGRGWEGCNLEVEGCVGRVGKRDGERRGVYGGCGCGCW